MRGRILLVAGRLFAERGYDDVIWSVTARNGQPGGYVVQAVRVGSAILVSQDSGEYSRGTTGFGARALNRDDRAFAPRLCRWTLAGC